MNGLVEFAKMLKERENAAPEGLTEGTVESLEPLSIRINDKLVLNAAMTGSLVNLYVKDIDGNYIFQNKKVYVLPFPEDLFGAIQKYLVLGGDAHEG